MNIYDIGRILSYNEFYKIDFPTGGHGVAESYSPWQRMLLGLLFCEYFGILRIVWPGV